MAKESGLGMTCTIDDYLGAATAISNDVTSATFDIPSGVQDTSGVNYSANERIHLRADMVVTLNGVFNPTGAHLIFENFRTILAGQVGRTTTIVVSAQTLADELLFASANVQSQRLLEAGYQFRYPELEGALRHVLGQAQRA